MRPALVLGAICLTACKGADHDLSTGSPASLNAQVTIPPAAIAPDLGRVTGTSLLGAEIVVTVDGTRYAFGKHCKDHAGGVDGLAAGGFIFKPRRPQQVWIEGCDDATGYFHVVLDHGPTVGIANASVFSIVLPG